MLAAHKSIGFLGGIARVQPHAHQTHRHTADVRPPLLQHVAQTAPNLVTCRVALEHPVLDQPSMLLAPKTPDRHLDTVFLDVDAR